MIVVVRSERGLGEENFVQNNPQGPPVDAVIMPLTNNHFWRTVPRAATNGVRSARNAFGEAKVHQLAVPPGVKDKILKL